jgi:hypothetical protein
MGIARGKAEKMEVRVDEPGQHCVAGAIDPRRASADGTGGGASIPDRDDTPSRDRERGGERPSRIARQDTRVLEQELDGINPTTEAASLP